MGKAVQPPEREMVHIFLLNLKNFFTRNRLLAGAFMLLLVVCLGGALFGVNYIFCNIDSYNIYMSEQNTYSVTARGGERTNGVVEAAIEEFGQDLFLAFTEFSNETRSPVDKEDGTARYDDITAIAYYSDEYGAMLAEAGGMFTRDQLAGRDKIVILDSGVYDSSYLGQKYILNGEEFTVEGFSSGNFVPLFALENSFAESYTLSFGRRLSEEEIESLRQASISLNSGGECILNIPEEDSVSFLDYLPMLVPTFVLVLLGFVNLNYLYTYFVRMRERMYAVFRLCGAGQGKVLGLFLAEAFFLFTAAFLAGLLAYKLIMPVLFDASLLSMLQSGLLISDRLGFGRWACVYLVSAACFALAFVPALVRAARADAVVRQEE